MTFVSDLAEQHVAVIGAGVTGAALIRFLNKFGAKITLFDDSHIEIAGLVSESQFPSSNELKIDFAVVSPGWRLDHPLISSVREAEVAIYSELDFAWKVKQDLAPNQRWIALTGTNGKTTTIQMVQSIVDFADIKGRACGNVGEPVIEIFNNADSYDLLALELSSFQIEWSHLPQYEAVAILNIAEDHIDWHGSFNNYANAKLKLLNQAPISILNGDDIEIVTRSSQFSSEKIFYFLEVPRTRELGLVEDLLIDRAFIDDGQDAKVIAELSDITPTVPHNISNALAAAGLALAVGIGHEHIQKGLQNFQPDHHRLELVANIDGISWVDDSKATNPHAATAALKSYLSVVWIAGGLAKGAGMDQIVRSMSKRIKAAILIGIDRELIAEALQKYAPHVPIFRIDKTDDSATLIEHVVRKAIEIAEEGDTVLLAPACASMDQFRNYAERGDLFAKAVREILAS